MCGVPDEALHGAPRKLDEKSNEQLRHLIQSGFCGLIGEPANEYGAVWVLVRSSIFSRIICKDCLSELGLMHSAVLRALIGQLSGSMLKVLPSRAQKAWIVRVSFTTDI